MTTIQRIIHIGIFTVLATAQFLILYFAFLQFYPFEPATIGTFEPEVKEATVGATLVFTLQYNKKMNIPADVRRSIVCGDFVFAMPTEHGSVKKGEYNYKRLFQLPDVLPENIPCHMSLDFTYYVYPFRTIQSNVVSKEFTIRR